MSTIVRCDRCGSTAPAEEGIFSRFEPCRAAALMYWPEDIDLCHACTCALVNWVHAYRKENPDPLYAVKPSPREPRTPDPIELERRK